jgi:hypothetical protein
MESSPPCWSIKPDVADIADKVPPPAEFPYLARISFVINQDHPGQGNSGPPLLAGQPGPGLPIEFPNHFVSLYEAGSLSTIFDPSYGLWFSSTTALANAQNAWAQASVAGFRWLFTNDAGEGRLVFRIYDWASGVKTNGNVLEWTPFDE